MVVLAVLVDGSFEVCWKRADEGVGGGGRFLYVGEAGQSFDDVREVRPSLGILVPALHHQRHPRGRR